MACTHNVQDLREVGRQRHSAGLLAHKTVMKITLSTTYCSDVTIDCCGAISWSCLDQSMLLRVCDLKHSTTLLRGIQHESYMDIMFICRGNVKVFAQKLVLLSVSPFMKLLLSHVSCCPHNIFCVSLPDISPVALQLVLDFLYEGVMKVRESELQDFSDAMFVLGIEVPPTATALKMELLDVPEVPLQRSQMPPPPPLVGSHLDLGEPVDPLNIPDYYHDQNMMPRVALPVSVAPSTSNSVSAMNANIVEQKPVTRSAVDARTQVSTLENPSTGRPRPELVVIVIPDDVDQFYDEESQDYTQIYKDGEYYKESADGNFSNRVFVKQEPMDDHSNNMAVSEDITAKEQEREETVDTYDLQQKSVESKLKSIRMALDRLQEIDSCAMLKADAGKAGCMRNLRKRNWSQICVYQLPRRRQRLSKKQYQELEKAFVEDKNLSQERISDLAKKLEVTMESIEGWLKNRLTKQRKDIFKK